MFAFDSYSPHLICYIIQFTFFPLLAHKHSVNSEIVFNDAVQSAYLSSIYFSNSSLEFNHLSLVANCKCPLLSLSSGSCCINFCDLAVTTPLSLAPFACSGQILLNSVSLPDSSADPFPTLITSNVCSNQLDNLSSLIEITNSEFTNIIRPYPGYSLLFTGKTISQTVKGCIFHNLSTPIESSLASQSDHCVLESSRITDGSEGIYGSIVTGLTAHTFSSFSCFNTTFARCARTNTDYTGSQRSRIQLSNTSASHTFTSCTFSDISSSSTGGSLFCNGTSVSIYIKALANSLAERSILLG